MFWPKTLKQTLSERQSIFFAVNELCNLAFHKVHKIDFLICNEM